MSVPVSRCEVNSQGVADNAYGACWLLEGKPIKLPSASGAQPMLADGTGDMKMDLLGQASQSGSAGTLEMWENVFGARNSTEAFTL